MSFLSYKVLLENSLYTNPIERANLVADKQKLMDALLINFFGFLGLYAISDKRGQMQHYSSEEKKLIPSMIGDENKDVSLVIRLALDAGILKQTGANNMSKLLALIKQKQVKATDIDSAKIREFASEILYTSHPPTTYIKQAFNDFIEGRSDVAHLAKSFFEIVRTKKDYHPITVEFRALALTYRPYFDQLPDVSALTPGAVPHSHAADSLNNRVKKGQTRAPSGPVAATGNSTTPAAVAVAAATPAKIKKVKSTAAVAVAAPAAPVAPVVVQGMTHDFFVEAFNARGQKEINAAFKKYGVVLPSKDTAAQMEFVRNFKLWAAEFSGSLRTRSPAMPKLNQNDCGSGAAKYIKKYSKSSYYAFLKFVWDCFSYYNPLKESLELVNHSFDGKNTGKKILEQFSHSIGFLWYKEQIADYVLSVLRNTQPTQESVKKSIELLTPFDSYFKDFEVRISSIRSDLMFTSMIPADAVMTQLKNITHDTYNSFVRFNLPYSSVQIVDIPTGGRNIFIPETTFKTLLPIQQETLKLLGDRLKVQTESDALAVLEAAVNRKTFTDSEMKSALSTLHSFLNKSLITRDVYESNVMKLFSADFHLASVMSKSAGVIDIDSLINNNLSEFVSIIQGLPNLVNDIVPFLKLTGTTSKVIPQVFSTANQDDFIKLYLDNRASWELSGVLKQLEEIIGQNYSPNENLLDRTSEISTNNFLLYPFWKNSVSDQKLSETAINRFKESNVFIKHIRHSFILGASDSEKLAEMWQDLIETNPSLKTLFIESINKVEDLDIKRWIENDSTFDGIGFAVMSLGFIPDSLEKRIRDIWEEELVLKNNSTAVPKSKNSILSKIGESVLTKVFESGKTNFSKFEKITMTKTIPKLAKKHLEEITEADIKEAIENDTKRGWLNQYHRSNSNWFKFVDTITQLKDSEGCPKNLGRLANVAFRIARDNKKIFKKQFRDEFAEEVLGLMMSDVESKDAQLAFSELEDTLLKKRFLTQFVNVELATKAQEELNNKGLPIAPVSNLTKTQVAAVLKLNNVEIPFDRSLIKSNDIKVVKKQVEDHTKKAGFQELAVKEVQGTTKELIAESIRLDKYNRHAHGETAFLVKRMFDVSIPRQKTGYPAWKAAHPKATEMLQFHGTASLPAAMIMRYGFTVVDQSIANAAGIKYTGKMLGDGVYCSNVIDKVGQYLGESGMTRRFGTKGYLFEMNALMEEWGKKVSKNSFNDYASAGTGRMGEAYNTVSPEWAMRDAEQFNIFRCYHVEIISKTKMKELKEEYLKESFTEKRFSEFLKEAREEEVNMKKISYCFVDGTIPVSENLAEDFDTIDFSKYPNATLDFNRQGVVLQFDCPDDQEEFHETVIWTRQFMQDKEKLDLFLKLLGNKK
ncbi:MAG TPA: hypothetical protein PK317_00410 [Coprothermobacter proteolyticus]|nr:hypothetical protein [Coprothermobacter proteolyticus]